MGEAAEVFQREQDGDNPSRLSNGDNSGDPPEINQVVLFTVEPWLFGGELVELRE
jgi:hypothetical protein